MQSLLVFLEEQISKGNQSFQDIEQSEINTYFFSPSSLNFLASKWRLLASLLYKYISSNEIEEIDYTKSSNQEKSVLLIRKLLQSNKNIPLSTIVSVIQQVSNHSTSSNIVLTNEEIIKNQTSIKPNFIQVNAEGGELNLAHILVKIPKNAVKSNTRFGITHSVENKAPEGIKALSKLFEMHPHNIEFNNDVELSFQVPTNDPCVLYVQKNTPESQELDKWLVVEPSVIEKQQASFLLKSFGIMFVGKPIDTNLSKSFATHNQAEPGLNFRAVCTCVPNTQGLVIIPMGYGDFLVNDVIDFGKVRCPKCGKSIEAVESVKQMILVKARGKIAYKLDSTREVPDPIAKEDTYNTSNELHIYGKIDENAERFSLFNITVYKL